jgi:hypothetical protein
VRRGDAVGERRLAPIAVEIAKARLEMSESTWVFWAAAALLAPLLLVSLLQGETWWSLGCFMLLAYFVYWLVIGRARLRARLERSIEKNRALIPSKPPAKKKRRAQQ